MLEKSSIGKIFSPTLKIFRKRQGTALTTYQRVKKYRMSNQDIETESNEIGTSLEEKRREENKNRIELEKKRESTPFQKAKEFFKDPEPIIQELIEKGLNEQIVRQEINKFISYWTEPTKSGKLEHWETKPTFEITRRLATWFSKYDKFNNQKITEKKGITI